MLIPRKIFTLRKMADRDSSRFAITGLRFERDAAGQPLAVATDGRRLMVAAWQESDAKKYPSPPAGFDLTAKEEFATILPVADCDKLEKNKIPAAALRDKPILQNVALDEQNANGRVSIVAADATSQQQFSVPSIEGRFPAWRDCCPVRRDSVSVALPASQLREMLEIAEKVAGDHITLSLDANSPSTSPVFLSSASTEGRAFGAIMPLHADCLSNWSPVGSINLQQPQQKAALKSQADEVARLQAELTAARAAIKIATDELAALKAAEPLPVAVEVADVPAPPAPASPSPAGMSAAFAVAAPALATRTRKPRPSQSGPAADEMHDWRRNGRYVVAAAHIK